MLILKRNILKFVQKHFPEHRIVSSGDEAQVNCIFHSDNHHHLYINLSKGIYHCFSCSAKGTFFELAKVVSPKQHFKIPENTVEAFSDILAQDVAVTVPPLPPETEYFSSINRYSKVAYDYLYCRNITEEEIYFYKIGYCHDGKYAGRIIVPILDRADKEVSFIARDYTGLQSPKVITPHAIAGSQGVKDHVFNLFRAAKTKKLIIGEGVFDAIALGVSGIALLGKTITRRQLALIHSVKVHEVVIALDPDAQKEALLLAKTLSSFQASYRPKIKIATIPAKEDPSSLGKEKCKEYVSQAQDYVSKVDFDL